MDARLASPIIEFRHVDVWRGARRALHDLNLVVRSGEHLAILGPNGSGKSTLIKTMARELYPRARPGLVCRLFGESERDVFDLRKRLGIVSNDLQGVLARDLSGLDLVLSGYFSSVGLWPGQKITPGMRRQALGILRRVGAASLADRPADHLSSGELRRLLIGRALIHEPRALLLDEPTTSLDFRAAREFRATLSRLAREGLAIILVTHQVEDIIPEVNRVVLLKEGRLFADGPKKSVLTTQRLRSLFGTNLRVDSAEGHYRIW